MQVRNISHDLTLARTIQRETIDDINLRIYHLLQLLHSSIASSTAALIKLLLSFIIITII